MPRYSDEWLIDRVLFEYVSGGSCACCGLQHFLPNGTADLINAMTDLETDQANAEVAALANHPWPAELRDQIWADRVRLRQKLKREMKGYKSFWDDHGEGFAAWCRQQQQQQQQQQQSDDGNNNGQNVLRRLVQLSRNEVMEVVRQKYNIHSAYAVVLCAVLEQVAGFRHTGYPPDGRGDSELAFESHLKFERFRGGFTMNLVSDDGTLNEDVLDVWLKRMETLGGPKLLERGPSRGSNGNGNGNDDEGEEGEADDPVVVGPKPSFQSDRRIARLLIARYFADCLQKRYVADNNTVEGKEEDEGATDPAAAAANDNNKKVGDE